jgi:hypothetical protein
MEVTAAKWTAESCIPLSLSAGSMSIGAADASRGLRGLLTDAVVHRWWTWNIHVVSVDGSNQNHRISYDSTTNLAVTLPSTPADQGSSAGFALIRARPPPANTHS